MWAELNETWSFGRKIGVGFAAVVGLTMLAGVITILALREVVSSKDRVLDVNARGLVNAQQIDNSAEKRVSAMRGFLITGRAELHRRCSDASVRRQPNDSTSSPPPVPS